MTSTLKSHPFGPRVSLDILFKVAFGVLWPLAHVNVSGWPVDGEFFTSRNQNTMSLVFQVAAIDMLWWNCWNILAFHGVGGRLWEIQSLKKKRLFCNQFCLCTRMPLKFDKGKRERFSNGRQPRRQRCLPISKFTLFLCQIISVQFFWLTI